MGKKWKHIGQPVCPSACLFLLQKLWAISDETASEIVPFDSNPKLAIFNFLQSVMLDESESIAKYFLKCLSCCLHFSLRVQLQPWTLRHFQAVSTLNVQFLCRCSGINMAAHLSICTKE
jgi:hypothetical protein